MASAMVAAIKSRRPQERLIQEAEVGQTTTHPVVVDHPVAAALPGAAGHPVAAVLQAEVHHQWGLTA
jgi:hypothetical protein